jgi:uncharacterized RDD family membrane protein YckC
MLCRNHIDVSSGVRRCARCGSPFCSDCLVDISGRPYCATCKGEQLLDVRSGVDAATLDYASVLRRFGGLFVDNIIVRIGATALVTSVTSSMGGSTGSLLAAALLGVLLAVTYDTVLLANRGQTVGKMAVRVKVVSSDGSAITQGQAFKRSLVSRFLPIITHIPAFFTPDRRTLHDMVADTRVINWK